METIEEARKVKAAAHSAWWKAYSDRSPDEPQLKIDLDRLIAEAVAKFGKPEVADCNYCGNVSVFGGPSHHASRNCRSGRHPHCTCDTCF